MKSFIGEIWDKRISFDYKKIRCYSARRWPKGMGDTHGVEHWDRVARFGSYVERHA
jgi:hypothetical protein